MEMLQKAWVRILISLVAGGTVMEAMHLMTATDINDRSDNTTAVLFWPVTIIVFLILSYIAKLRKYK
jgi:uncharacterized membrane protein YidH (DUF202 family)